MLVQPGSRLVGHRVELERPEPVGEVGALLAPQLRLPQQGDTRPAEEEREDGQHCNRVTDHKPYKGVNFEFHSAPISLRPSQRSR